MLWDTHMHCYFSGDSEAAPEDMVKSAIEKGLDGICFTDHLDYDYPDDPELFLLDLDAHYEGIHKLQEKYQGIFNINYGIELGLQPQVVKDNLMVTEKYPFDFVIGSSHVVHGFDPYYPQYYEGRSEEEAYREYFESILENINTPVDFDVYGHIDYVVRYGPNKNEFYTYEKYADIIDEILRQLISKGKGIEVNCGGFRSGLGHPNPTEAIIKRYKELGGEIITLGADAHKPEDVAISFHKLPSILKDAGFDYFTVFKNRKPLQIKL